jgi:long-chain acyl-CoA synthetase
VPRVLELLRAHLLAHFDSLPQQMAQMKDLSIWKRWWGFRSVHRALGWKFWAIVSGGASLPPQLEDFWNVLGFALIQGYGMTETAALITLNHPFRIGRGTIGKALPGREVRISDEGEILVRGDMLAKATWQRGAMHPREGEWLATGDLASESDSGELRFLGRKGDVIVTSAGMNIHPADLEEAMKHQSGVRDCVVVPCEMAGGTEPVAVALFSGSDEQLQRAATQANRTLSTYQQIRRILQWPDLQFPYTSTGKLLRRQVAQWACAKLSNRASTTPPSRVALVSLISEITGEPITKEGDQLRLSEDMHLDSLGRVQLQSTLEQTLGLELEDDVIATVETLGDLRALVDQSLSIEGSPSTEDSADQISAQIAARATRPFIESAKIHDESLNENTYPHWPWRWPIHAIRVAFIELIMRPLIWLLAAPKVQRSAERLPAGPLLVIANHVTAYDGALVLYALPAKLRRNVAIAMSGEMLLDLRHGRNQGNALLNVLARPAYWLLTLLFNVFPLPRQRGFRRSFAHAGEAMDRGYSVLIFPEGTRSSDGKLHPFRKGIGLLSEQSHAPVLPMALVGLGEMRATGARWFRSGELAIHAGKIIPVDDEAQPAQLTARYEDGVRNLLAESSVERLRIDQ